MGQTPIRWLALGEFDQGIFWVFEHVFVLDVFLKLGIFNVWICVSFDMFWLQYMKIDPHGVGGERRCSDGTARTTLCPSCWTILLRKKTIDTTGFVFTRFLYVLAPASNMWTCFNQGLHKTYHEHKSKDIKRTRGWNNLNVMYIYILYIIFIYIYSYMVWFCKKFFPPFPSNQILCWSSQQHPMRLVGAKYIEVHIDITSLIWNMSGRIWSGWYQYLPWNWIGIWNGPDLLLDPNGPFWSLSLYAQIFGSAISNWWHMHDDVTSPQVVRNIHIAWFVIFPGSRGNGCDQGDGFEAMAHRNSELSQLSHEKWWILP